MPSVITLKITDGLAVGNVPARNFFLARVSVCITVGVSVGGWFFLFATELATEMGFTDDCFTDGALPSVNPSVFFSPTDFIAVTDGINPSVKLDNVVVLDIPLFQNRKTKMIFFKSFLIDYLLFLDPQLD
jgi:hypothetical protein